MRNVVLFLLLISSVLSYGQIIADKKSYDFGELYPNAQTYVDIKFTNTTAKKHYLLNIDKPRDVYYVFSGKVLLPDSSITVRLKINDGQKGKFSHNVALYFSDSNKPVTIRLTGNVKAVNSNPLTECPDFNSDPRGGDYGFDITVKVIDSLTREPIRKSKVYFVQNGGLVGSFYTNKEGIVRKKFPMGYYFLTAEKDNYLNNHKEGYLNFQRNYVVIELHQPPTTTEEDIVYEEPEQPEEEIEIVIDNEPTATTEPPEEEITPVVVEEEVPLVIDETPLEELPDTLFDEQHFKLNNISFILDVSSSMNSHGKLDLLKLSMIELMKILRPDDLVSIIKYSSTVSVVCERKTGADKEEIIQKVNALKTSSSTAGGDAIQVAYRLNNKVYSPEKNNIVIMITDGAFNRGDKTYLELVAKSYEQKGIIFSVVGIKTSPYLTAHMKDVVAGGGGDFVEIRTVEDAQTKIVQEIRRTSHRKPL